LDISNTKVRNVKPLFNLTNLKVLNFSEEDIDENDLHIIEENNDGIIISQY
jgi:Leucine-rich repeat (LRR) protein